MAQPFDYSVPVPDISGPLSEIAGAIEQRRERKRLSEIGGMIQGGNLSGAAGMAFGQGKLDAGMNLTGMDQDRQAKIGQILANAARQADTPEKWAGYIDTVKRRFPGANVDQYSDFKSRDAVIGEFSDYYKDSALDLDRQRLEIERQKVAQDGVTGSYGLQPVLGQDADGNIVVMQLSKSGEAVASQLPDGVRVMSPGDKERDKVIGKFEGGAEADLPEALAKADDAIALIDQMRAHPGRETATGLSSTLDPRNYVAGTDATDFNVMSRQLQGKAFLEAFESLKGGGQITEVEGQKATEAVARLSAAQSDEAYSASLLELRNILERGKRRARTRAGQDDPDEAGWQTLRNGVRFREIR